MTESDTDNECAFVQYCKSAISTCPNFQKTEECTMSKPLYTGQGYLNKSEALGLKIY